MRPIIALAEAAEAAEADFYQSWAVVDEVTSNSVAFTLLGANQLDANRTSFKYESVGTLAVGDKIMVQQAGNGSWIITGKVVRIT